jgi:hypothetical protein
MEHRRDGISTMHAQLVRSMEGHTDTVEVVAVARNNENVYSGSRDSTLRQWKVFNGSVGWLRVGAANVRAAAYPPYCPSAARAYHARPQEPRVGDGRVARRSVLVLRQRGQDHSTVGHKLCHGACRRTTHLQRWSPNHSAHRTRKMQLVRTMNIGDAGCANTLAVSPDGRFVFSGNKDRSATQAVVGLYRSVTQWDVSDGTVRACCCCAADRPAAQFLTHGGACRLCERWTATIWE